MNQFFFGSQNLLTGQSLITGINTAITGTYVPAARARRMTLTYFASGTLGAAQKLSLQYPSPFQDSVGVEFFSLNNLGDGYTTTGIDLAIPQVRAIVTGISGSMYCSLFEQD